MLVVFVNVVVAATAAAAVDAALAAADVDADCSLDIGISSMSAGISCGMDLSIVLLSRFIISISGYLFKLSKSYGFVMRSNSDAPSSVRSTEVDANDTKDDEEDAFDVLAIAFVDDIGKRSGTGIELYY